jgi:hypothetical protein
MKLRCGDRVVRSFERMTTTRIAGSVVVLDDASVVLQLDKYRTLSADETGSATTLMTLNSGEMVFDVIDVDAIIDVLQRARQFIADRYPFPSETDAAKPQG